MNLKFRIIRNSILAVLIVVAVNLIILALLNFPSMALFQLKKYIWLLILLVLGFGVQIGLYTYLKHKSIVCSVTAMAGGGVSAISMILCCSHYLINILPFISLSFANFLTRYTFWILMFGIASNIAGIVFMLYKIKSMNKMSKVIKNNKKEK
ncbi:MAG TPA: hypothetical protein VJA86_03465 [Candidatus Nanoarchaeia archaeon]|nr:hypothetical protein [Candidatus Nanoarchaeia archaeon]